jgi:hypothetical protein
MPGSFILKAFLLANKAEIKGMFLEGYNLETFKRDMRAEGYEDGRKEGRTLLAAQGESGTAG